MPKVLNRRIHGIPENAVYVGRPTKWGNPFTLRSSSDRARVIAEYDRWIHLQPALLEAVKKELRGKDLVCWCAPCACHGDLLLKIANS